MTTTLRTRELMKEVRRLQIRSSRRVDALFAGRTRILISHRAATLAGCDLRVHLERGRLEVLPPAAVTVRS